jgi:hypothetical protein
MVETELHREGMTYLIQALQSWYREVPDVHVGGNLFLYYVQGDPRAVVSPDVYVTKGIQKGLRRVYKLWEEGRADQGVGDSRRLQGFAHPGEQAHPISSSIHREGLRPAWRRR